MLSYAFSITAFWRDGLSGGRLALQQALVPEWMT